MTSAERVQALAAFGFTERQAAFVATVALHSGYCVRRQYAAFAGVQYGHHVRDFLDQLVARHYARRFTYRRDRGHIYHLFSHAIYAALEQDDNRNRRHASPALIARKLMLLDFVIAQPTRDWYVTEREKVDLFTRTLRVPVHALPHRTYDAVRRVAGPTVRYCVQKLPVFVTADPVRVHFVCLVTDPAARDIGLFVREHHALLTQLPDYRAVIVRPAHISNDTQCTVFWARAMQTMLGAPRALDADTVRWYLGARRRIELGELRTTGHIECPSDEVVAGADGPHKLAQFEAVRRWFDDDWMRIEPKLRTSIVEGISVFLSLFDDNPSVKHTFCPPKDTYDSQANADGSHGIPLPPIGDLIEQGKVIALNFPAAMNPGLARAIGTMLKQDFQRAVLNRIPRMSTEPGHSGRPVLFLCDEYQAFATSGENEPSGDEKFFSLARQARCIPIVATQSISSLRTVLPGESWRTLLQGLRTKIFLTLSDDFSAGVASDLCGKAERLKPGYTLTEAGQDARVSLLTGRPAAHRATVSVTKTYSLTFEHVFEPKIFAELQNAQAIVLVYDGSNPLPPTYCYLKPHYLDVQTSYFDHLAAGAL